MTTTFSRDQYTTFAKVPIRGTFQFVPAVGGPWVKTGTRTYATAHAAFSGQANIIKGFIPSYTGKVTFWQGSQSTISSTALKVVRVNPPEVVTEANPFAW